VSGLEGFNIVTVVKLICNVVHSWGASSVQDLVGRLPGYLHNYIIHPVNRRLWAHYIDKGQGTIIIEDLMCIKYCGHYTTYVQFHKNWTLLIHCYASSVTITNATIFGERVRESYASSIDDCKGSHNGSAESNPSFRRLSVGLLHSPHLHQMTSK
jgi:hypothetical protein